LEVNLRVKPNRKVMSPKLLDWSTRNLFAVNFETELVNQCGRHLDLSHRTKQATLFRCLSRQLEYQSFQTGRRFLGIRLVGSSL
jgi:hypothetical protein